MSSPLWMREYPDAYQGPKPLQDQILRLAALFSLDPHPALTYAEHLPKLPEGAEGWFAVLSPTACNSACKSNDEVVRHSTMVKRMYEIISSTRPLHSSGAMDLNRLRVRPRTAVELHMLVHQQPGDILIVAAQLGMRHRGLSASEVWANLAENEFGLTSVAVGSILLTHPERLRSYNDLQILCAGEEFVIYRDSDDFTNVPCFMAPEGELECSLRGSADSRRDIHWESGGATAFI